ncbi:low affinity iron permease family protein [Nocardia sp. CDC160]|uniref:low affinity iron permease family protein n=1 Tax=Nocardia sp. CDC160 TaxID=3112166 RepID=UPI002DC05EBF|nr:low affinity iron permease family protein [Nocardia sp. CDC160]MEC3914764.1 low affinity iron permease family protein [Nocardia sp. CDC160]
MGRPKPQAGDRGNLSLFDRFATSTSDWASRAGFFVFCVGLVVVWVPSILVLPSVDTWQLVINTATTIITFLLVALLQNTQRRSDAAVQDKLNAVAGALAAFMGELSAEYPELDRHRSELADSVGLEKREGSGRRQTSDG